MAENRRKKQRPDCATRLVLHHHDFQDKNVKRCQLPDWENCCLFTFLPSFYPSLFSPTNSAFEAVWQFEGNRRVSGLFKVSNVRSFLSLCSSFPQTLKAQPYRGIGAKEEGSGRHSSAKVEFQPSSVRAKGLCARKNKHASVREYMPRNMPLPFLPSSCEATQSSAKTLIHIKKEDTGIGGVKKRGRWCVLPIKEPYATVRVSCSSPLFSSSVLDSWTSRRGTQTNHAIACF